MKRDRSTQRLLSHKGFHIGPSVLYTVYWTVNLILALTYVDLTNLSYVRFSRWQASLFIRLHSFIY